VNFNALVHAIDPEKINDGGVSVDDGTPLLTVNKTFWSHSNETVPLNVSAFFAAKLGCQFVKTTIENDNVPVPLPVNAQDRQYITHAAYDRSRPERTDALLTNFENIALFPKFVRMAVCYDEFPSSTLTASSAVWSGLLEKGVWKRLLGPESNPALDFTFQNGRQVAVAYREHGGMPFAYQVSNYDARGRVTQLLRFSEELGFEGTYYEYNSRNLPIVVRTISQLHQHSTWYTYDDLGRTATVYTKKTGNGYFYPMGENFLRCPQFDSRPENAVDIRYSYDGRNRIVTREFLHNGVVKYTLAQSYNARQATVAMNGSRGTGHQDFNLYIGRDKIQQITSQQVDRRDANDNQIVTNFNYLYQYDQMGRLLQWRRPVPVAMGEIFSYDNLGNRVTQGYDVPQYDLTMKRNYNFDNIHAGRLTDVGQVDASYSSKLKYYENGALQRRTTHSRVSPPGVASRFEVQTEDFVYGYRNEVNEYRSASAFYSSATVSSCSINLDDPAVAKDVWNYAFNPTMQKETVVQSKRAVGAEKAKARIHYHNGRSASMAVWYGVSFASTCDNPNQVSVWYYPQYFNVLGATGYPEISLNDNGEKEFLINDVTGNVRERISGATGLRTGNTDFEPFGQPISGNVPSQGQAGFIGDTKSTENAYTQLGARLYDPSVGRFLSIDSKWSSYLNLNPYQYSYNNPISYSDNSGFGVAEVERVVNALKPEFGRLWIESFQKGIENRAAGESGGTIVFRGGVYSIINQHWHAPGAIAYVSQPSIDRIGTLNYLVTDPLIEGYVGNFHVHANGSKEDYQAPPIPGQIMSPDDIVNTYDRLGLGQTFAQGNIDVILSGNVIYAVEVSNYELAVASKETAKQGMIEILNRLRPQVDADGDDNISRDEQIQHMDRYKNEILQLFAGGRLGLTVYLSTTPMQGCVPASSGPGDDGHIVMIENPLSTPLTPNRR